MNGASSGQNGRWEQVSAEVQGLGVRLLEGDETRECKEPCWARHGRVGKVAFAWAVCEGVGDKEQGLSVPGS